MQDTKKIEKIGQLCFWIGLITELLIVIVDKSAYINPYEGILFRFTFMLFCIKVATTKYSRGEWAVVISIGIIAILSYFINERDEAVRAVAFVVSCKDVDLKKILKITLVITAIGSAILFILSALGILGDFAITANFGRGSTPAGSIETRYCFGMGHPNAFQTMLFMMSTIYIYLKAHDIKLLELAGIAAINIISYMYTDSNTGLLVMIAAITGVTLLKYCKMMRNSKVVYILGVVTIIAIVIFSAYGSHVGRNTPVMRSLDKILNGRFQYSHIYEMARIENWKLFADASNTEYFDQGFIRLFYWYGIIPGLVYVGANIYLIWQSYKKKDYTLLVIIVAYAVFMIMEAHIISVYLLRNYLLIWLGYYWYQPFRERNSTEYNFWQIKGLVGGH